MSSSLPFSITCPEIIPPFFTLGATCLSVDTCTSAAHKVVALIIAMISEIISFFILVILFGKLLQS